MLVLTQTGGFAYGMATSVLPYHGQQLLELAILSLSAILFAWVSLGFWTAVTGFVLLCCGRDRHAITRAVPPGTALPPNARTAVVMPICNEHVARVFAGLRATYESVAGVGALRHFDFFILSDSSEPDTLAAERHAWRDLCESVEGFGRVFYRWRRHRIKRKSGNVADFWPQSTSASRPLERTFHLLSGADGSCAPYTESAHSVVPDLDPLRGPA